MASRFRNSQVCPSRKLVRFHRSILSIVHRHQATLLPQNVYNQVHENRVALSQPHSLTVATESPKSCYVKTQLRQRIIQQQSTPADCRPTSTHQKPSLRSPFLAYVCDRGSRLGLLVPLRVGVFGFIKGMRCGVREERVEASGLLRMYVGL